MARASMFCPFCNADGERQPILSPMACVYVLASGEPPDDAKPAPAPPHFEYRCSRCGYTEIHEQLFDEAA